MLPAKPNNYGITHAGYVTDMSSSDDLRTQLKKAGITHLETPLNMGTLFADPASIVTYTNPTSGRIVSVLIIPLAGPDSWCEEYSVMVGTDHESALTRDWGSIVDEVRKLFNPLPPKEE